MINADEHKKLLAQIAELEKDSINYFDVEKEFFLIDSENLSQVRPKLYGYSIQRTGIYEDDNLTAEAIAGLNGRGCYIYVEVKDGQITIKQDLNGSWGIYLFRQGDYFALSNSFFRLVDHVKFKYPLTVNRDYCYHILTADASSYAYFETAVNNIQRIERNAIIHINLKNKSLELELIDYKEHTIPLDSEEGVATLDRWIEFWSDVFGSVAKHTNFLMADLTGGFDTRMSFISAIHSGADLSKMRIFSLTDSSHKEDYEIASQIGAHYGFTLNKPFPENESLNYSLSDVLNLDLYNRQLFHKFPSVTLTQKRLNKYYVLNGYSGETNRGYAHGSPKNFMAGQISQANFYSNALAREIAHSIKTIYESAYNFVCDKYKIEDQDSEDIPQYLYQETRVRNHYGKETLTSYFRNIINISPALDPKIRTIRMETTECPDTRLLMALLFVRHEPDLLDFPIQRGRTIAPETIEYAKKINERFPLVHKDAVTVTGGGIFIYSRVTSLSKRFLTKERIISLFPLDWRNVA